MYYGYGYGYDSMYFLVLLAFIFSMRMKFFRDNLKKKKKTVYPLTWRQTNNLSIKV